MPKRARVALGDECKVSDKRSEHHDEVKRITEIKNQQKADCKIENKQSNKSSVRISIIYNSFITVPYIYTQILFLLGCL